MHRIRGQAVRKTLWDGLQQQRQNGLVGRGRVDCCSRLVLVNQTVPTVYFALTVTDRFGPTVGRKLLKPSGNKRTSWGDRQVDRIKLAAAFTSRRAPWRPGAALASRGAGDALRGAGKLCERCNLGYDRLSTPADLAPSVLNRIAHRKLRWIPLATAHTPICSAHDLVCARPLDAFECACGCGACWLLLLPPTQCVQMPKGTAGTVH